MQNSMNGTIAVLNDYPKDKYNVLIPVSTMQAMSSLQRVIVNTVQLDTTVDNYGSGRDIYKEKSSGKFAITKVAGMKLAAAANISIVSTEKGRTETCNRCIEMARATGKAQPCGQCASRLDLSITVTLRVPEPSGGFRLMAATKEMYVEEERKGMKKGDDGSEKQFERFLPHRQSIGESKAFMRALRAALGLSATYTLDELKKPFVIAHVVPNLDAPEIREHVAAGYLQSMGMMYENPAARHQLPGAQAALPTPQQAVEIIPDDDDASSVPLPWDLPPDDEPEPEGPVCADCGYVIERTSGKGGKVWEPEDIVKYSTQRFKRILCPPCQESAYQASRG